MSDSVDRPKRPSLFAAEQALLKAGHEVLHCSKKLPAVNGNADQLAITSKPGYVLINCQKGVDFHALQASMVSLGDLVRVKTPNDGFHLYAYMDTPPEPQVLATNRDGSPRITVVPYAVTYPSEGYEIEHGFLMQIPTWTWQKWQTFKVVAGFQTIKPEVITPIPSRLPAVIPELDSPTIIDSAVVDGRSSRLAVPPSVSDVPETTDENVELIYQTLNPTQDNVALVFEDRYKNEMRFCATWGQWLNWNECKWAPDHTLIAFHYCREMARKLNRLHGKGDPTKASFARGVEAFCRASRVFATKSDQWDRNYWLLNNPTQTVDLKMSDSHTHVRTDYITKATRVAPADGPRPVFDMFLKDICLGDEGLMQYHQRSLGACLSGAIQDNFLLFWYGTGQNGKNTFGDLIAWILGDYAKVIPTETLISTKNPQHPTTLANLRGLRLAVCSEVAEGAYWDEARVKSLTGDTDISARFMRQDFFEFPRTHKHLVYGNHRPMLRMVDPGMQARLHIVPFKAFFPPDARDPDMRKKLEAEAPQILNWLIAGHAQWLEDGYLKKCDAVQKETQLYFEMQSTNDLWLTECCRESDTARGSAKDLYQSFKAWKEMRGEGVLSQTRWGEWMSSRFVRVKSHGVIVYDGVELKPATVFDFEA